MHLNVRRQLLRKNGQLIFKLKYLIQLKSQSHQLYLGPVIMKQVGGF